MDMGDHVFSLSCTPFLSVVDLVNLKSSIIPADPGYDKFLPYCAHIEDTNG